MKGVRVLEEMPDGFVSSVRDVLAHFYDHAYLIQHPLLLELLGSADRQPTAAARELRRLLLDAVEELRPRPNTPADDPAWRPYAVIHSRYILGKELEEVERELALGRRQIQREQRRGLAALALALWEKRPAAAEVVDSGQESPLLQEISRLAAETDTVQLQPLLASAVAATQPLAQRCGVRLQVALGFSEHVLGDPSLLRQLVVAALSFAIRAAPGGELRVGTGRLGGKATLTLIASPGTSLPAQPSALPAALIALAEAQRGEITCQADGKSLRLEIRLPTGYGESTVAIVEDNEDVVALFARYLAGQGYRLVPVHESSAALDRLAELMPAIVILDVMMRDVDGWEILQRLKADPGLRQIPVVVCSVLDEPELAYSIGADAYLRKPVRPAQLLQCLSAVSRR